MMNRGRVQMSILPPKDSTPSPQHSEGKPLKTFQNITIESEYQVISPKLKMPSHSRRSSGHQRLHNSIDHIPAENNQSIMVEENSS